MMRWNDTHVRDVMLDQLQGAIACGLRRAHKHTDTPTEDAIIEQINREVEGVIFEFILTDEPEMDMTGVLG